MDKGHHAAHAHNTKHLGAHTLRERGADFVLVEDIHPPPRIELARERMLLCRLYLGLIRSINEDYGASFAGQNDSSPSAFTYFCAPSCARRLARARSQAP
jgi:hypothetical protein